MSVARKAAPPATRFDIALARVSSPSQDPQGQIDNMTAMLRARGVHVPAERWHVLRGVSRADVAADPDFQTILRLIEADRVGNCFIERQDRFGSDDDAELLILIGVLRAHGTALIDLTAGLDLTGKDDVTQMTRFMGSYKSLKERRDLAQGSLRTRISLFRESGSWPTGKSPYAYGKRCLSADGKPLWQFIPADGVRGELYHFDADGNLTLTHPDCRIPRKSKGAREKTVLVPGRPDDVKAVKLVYDLFVRLGLSKRGIAGRLNGEGLRFNGKPFSHWSIVTILRNPAYAGDTVFGRRRTAKHFSFAADGLLVPANGHGPTERDPAECLVRKDTHEALVSRAVWEAAQAKLDAEQTAARAGHKRFAVRNPAYYLRGLLVCGACGQPLAGDTATDPDTGRKTVVYVCSSHQRAHKNAAAPACGHRRISHDDAEKLLLDKLRELNVELETLASAGARANLQARLERLGQDDEEMVEQWYGWLDEGLLAFMAYLRAMRIPSSHDYATATDWWVEYHLPPWNTPHPDHAGQDVGSYSLAEFKKGLPTLRDAVRRVEEVEVWEAKAKLAELRAEHKTLTLAWAKAPEVRQAVLQAELDRLEAELRDWQPRTVPLSERIATLTAAEAERAAERERLLAEWSTLEGREKGEALKKIFKAVTLHWKSEWHPAKPRRGRPRTTARPGRWRHTLEPGKTQWQFTTADLGESW
jgi:DNA invertase Pin-like site-specific DNA recombinase